MIYCKLKKNKTKTSHRSVTSSPDHFNTDRSNSAAELDPVSFKVLTATDAASGKSSLKQQPGWQLPTLEAHRRLGKQTQRHLGVQSAEWRCNLSSKVSRVFLPVIFSAVRDEPLADAEGNCSSVLVPLGSCLCISRGRCSWLAIWQPLWVCCCC